MLELMPNCLNLRKKRNKAELQQNLNGNNRENSKSETIKTNLYLNLN